jgi:hypothetical protein
LRTKMSENYTHLNQINNLLNQLIVDYLIFNKNIS